MLVLGALALLALRPAWPPLSHSGIACTGVTRCVATPPMFPAVRPQSVGKRLQSLRSLAMSADRPIARASRSQGRSRGRGSSRGRGRGSTRRAQLRRLCSAIRSNEWADGTVDGMLDASATGWGVGEYRAMAQAASQVNDAEGALRVLRRMEAAGKPADVTAYGYAVGACAKANRPEEGRALLEELAASATPAEARAYNQVMSAYARQRRWSEALSLLRGMREASARPTVVSYNAVLSACSKVDETEAKQR